jgi:hypothetical protein
MLPWIRRPPARLIAALIVLCAASAAQASLLVLDPMTSTIQIDGMTPAPLAGRIETEFFEVSEPLPPGIDEVYEITNVLLYGGGQTITGPDESKFEFMGLPPFAEVLPAVSLSDESSFALTANFEILEVDGDRALFRYLLLSGVGPGAVEGTSRDGELTSLWVDARVIERVVWWEARFVEPCDPNGSICVSFPPSIWPDETVVDREIGAISFHAGLPIPEPHAALLFAVGFGLASWNCRSRQTRGRGSGRGRC